LRHFLSLGAIGSDPIAHAFVGHAPDASAGIVSHVLRVAGFGYGAAFAPYPTAGGTFAGALQVAKDAPKGANILAMLPDTGERYLSTPLFADIPADMTEEEQKISQSTPSHQMKPPAA
jgi:hypothetical protein